MSTTTTTTTGSPAPVASSAVAAAAPRPVPVLPRWPVTALFAFYPVWWFVGLLDLVLVPLSVVMTLYLVRTPGLRVPRGWGVWLLFLLWSGASVVMLDTVASLVGFTYRYLVYLGSTVLFVYLYNARSRITARYVAGLLTWVWVIVVVGGYLGIVHPSGTWRTPMSFLFEAVKSAVPQTAVILNNDLVISMVVRRFAQVNAAAFELAPRPAAPFRFTNNWGNVYSVLLPVVIAYARGCRPARRRLMLGVLLPLSAVPALLTLNRGMMLGIALAIAYVGIRGLLAGRARLVLATLAAGVVAALLFLAPPIQDRLDQRLEGGTSSTETRASVYQQAIDSVPGSPVFGYGAPTEGENPNAPPVGTQGQIWVFLVSHGPVAATLAMSWLLLAVVQSRRRWDRLGLAFHVSLLVGTVELTYYGAIPYGLPLLLTAAALALRRPTPRDLGDPSPGTVLRGAR